MKTVFFTDKTSGKAVAMLDQMAARDLPIEAIIIDVGRQRSTKTVKRSFGRMGIVEGTRFAVRKVSQKVRPRKRQEWKTNEFYDAYSPTVHLVDDFNGQECEQLLTEIEPDTIVLGSCSRIIHQNIIRIPAIGMLNAHPGVLPAYRGNDTFRWAIYHGDPIGIAIHYVDEGVDTGNILVQETITIVPGDTFKTIRKKARRLLGKLITDSLIQLSENGRVVGTPQVKEDGRQFYTMPVNLRKEVDQKLSSLEYYNALAAKEH